MANETDPNADAGLRSSTIVIAIIIPSFLVIMFITLIVLFRHRMFLAPRGPGVAEILLREERMKRRQNELESSIKTQHFYDWQASQKERNPECPQITDPVCAICLDSFKDDAQIRGLHCSHAFHSHCLDEWFTKYNEFCPLCHRPIIPGPKSARRLQRERTPPIPIVLMV